MPSARSAPTPTAVRICGGFARRRLRRGLLARRARRGLPPRPRLRPRNPHRSRRQGWRRAAAEIGLLTLEGEALLAGPLATSGDRPQRATSRAAPWRSSQHGTAIPARLSRVFVFFHERRVVVLDRASIPRPAGASRGRRRSGMSRSSPRQARSRAPGDKGSRAVRTRRPARAPARRRPRRQGRSAAARRHYAASSWRSPPRSPCIGSSSRAAALRDRRCDGSACASPTPRSAGSA